jgi:hypothetical protein
VHPHGLGHERAELRGREVDCADADRARAAPADRHDGDAGAARRRGDRRDDALELVAVAGQPDGHRLAGHEGPHDDGDPPGGAGEHRPPGADLLGHDREPWRGGRGDGRREERGGEPRRDGQDHGASHEPAHPTRRAGLS